MMMNTTAKAATTPMFIRIEPIDFVIIDALRPSEKYVSGINLETICRVAGIIDMGTKTPDRNIIG